MKRSQTETYQQGLYLSSKIAQVLHAAECSKALTRVIDGLCHQNPEFGPRLQKLPHRHAKGSTVVV